MFPPFERFTVLWGNFCQGQIEVSYFNSGSNFMIVECQWPQKFARELDDDNVFAFNKNIA